VAAVVFDPITASPGTWTATARRRSARVLVPQIPVSVETRFEMAVKTQKGKWDFKEPTDLALRRAQSLDAR
jgi:hypothetical protein